MRLCARPGEKPGGGNRGEERANVRVWIVATEAWTPGTLFDEPPASKVLFPALDGCVTRREAAEFVTGFNEQMLPHGGRRWAVARLASPMESYEQLYDFDHRASLTDFATTYSSAAPAHEVQCDSQDEGFP
jgi:hypothetical protein